MPVLKLLFSFLMLTFACALHAQSVSVKLARGAAAADHLTLRYEHWTNSSLNLTGGLFMEKTGKNLLDFSCYGVEVLGEYASSREGFEGGAFGMRAGLGACWQIEQEKWVYGGWTAQKRSAFGVVAELSGEWFMTQHFTLRAAVQQRVLFNPSIGRYRFSVGLVLVYNLNFY